tara:strand:- start:5413 stop:5841 length:429 start_codon:yes stop_codon:yes gene_type:complete
MMLNTLPKTAHQQTICEANFIRLKKILNNFKELQYCFNVVNPNNSSFLVIFNVIHKTNHTLIIEAKQSFEKKDLSNFIMRIQVSMDAKLVEVISYQGEKALPFFMKVSMTQSRDEKLQQNRFLTEWLESIFISGISTNVKFT